MDVDDSLEKAERCFDVAQHLNHPAVARAFMWNAVATGDAGIIRRAEASIARAAERREAATSSHT
jgi:DNA-binding phage protein